MPEFQIEITETLSRIVSVKANDINEAIQKVREQYRQSDIVLDSEDFITVDFNEIDNSVVQPQSAFES
ncbi:MAG: DpnD/PcfM family protein [Thermoguttaceae bacterium]|nr:DpnD/PcfM family protein [Thermoguttaceae bacterium]